MPSRAGVWGAVGLGGGVPTSGGDGITNMMQLVFQKAPHHAAIRALVMHDLDRGTREIGEVGPLYGRMQRTAWGHVTMASGVSVVAFDTCPSDDDTCFAFGLPVVAEAVWSRRFIGLGIQAFGNLNKKASYAGATLFLALGRLR